MPLLLSAEVMIEVGYWVLGGRDLRIYLIADPKSDPWADTEAFCLLSEM